MWGWVDSLVFISYLVPGKAHSTVTAALWGIDPSPATGTARLDHPVLFGTTGHLLLVQSNGPSVKTCDALQLPMLFGMR